MPPSLILHSLQSSKLLVWRPDTVKFVYEIRSLNTKNNKLDSEHSLWHAALFVLRDNHCRLSSLLLEQWLSSSVDDICFNLFKVSFYVFYKLKMIKF